MQDNSFDVPWFKEALQAGLQLDPSPRDINANLSVDGDVAAQRLVSAMQSTTTWTAFEAANRQLDADTRRELLDARQRLAQGANADATPLLDYEDPRIVLNRRRMATQAIVADLSPSARTYALAFDAIDDEINLVTTTVLAQLLAFGEPQVLSRVSNMHIEPSDIPTVSFDLPADGVAHVGRLYWTDDSIVRDTVHVEAFKVADSAVHGTRIRFSGRLLVGTAAAWRA